jgi:hypothetical protein
MPLAFVPPAKVLPADIGAAGESDSTINHQDLPVISKIDVYALWHQGERKETGYLCSIPK